MTLLALDLATVTGWAVIRDGERVASGTVRLRGELPERCGELRRFIRATAVKHGVTHIACEQPFIGRGKAATLSGCAKLGVAYVVAEAMCVPIVTVDVTAVKKHAAGSGNAKKPAMIAAARRRWNHEPKDDNEADALCVAAWALECVDWGE